MLLLVAAAWFLPLVVAEADATTNITDDDCSPSIAPRPNLGLLWASVPIIFFASLLGAGLPIAIAIKTHSTFRLIISVSCSTSFLSPFSSPYALLKRAYVPLIAGGKLPGQWHHAFYRLHPLASPCQRVLVLPMPASSLWRGGLPCMGLSHMHHCYHIHAGEKDNRPHMEARKHMQWVGDPSPGAYLRPI